MQVVPPTAQVAQVAALDQTPEGVQSRKGRSRERSQEQARVTHYADKSSGTQAAKILNTLHTPSHTHTHF